AVSTVPRERPEVFAMVLSPDLHSTEEGRPRISGSTGVLPLGLRRQTKHLGRLLRDLLVQVPDEHLLTVLPGDLLDRSAWIPESARIFASHCLPERLRHCRLADPEAGADRHLVLRALMRAPARLVRRRPHRESPRRNPSHSIEHIFHFQVRPET